MTARRTPTALTEGRRVFTTHGFSTLRGLIPVYTPSTGTGDAWAKPGMWRGYGYVEIGGDCATTTGVAALDGLIG